MNAEVYSSPEKFDTVINVIGGLESLNVVFDTLEAYFSNPNGGESTPTAYLRTEESSGRIDRMLRSLVISFHNDGHRMLLSALLKSQVPAQDREIVLFWHLALNNRLFREISTSVFAKAYLSGRGGLRKDDIVGYVKDFLGRNQHLKLDWSETTIDRLGSKYLNLMSKLNLISGGRTKSFHPIRLSGEALTIFIYLCKIHQPEQRNILSHELTPLCFISPDDLAARLKKLSTRGAFTIELNGVALNIDLTLPYGELPYVLYRRP
jgi:hypothetical protein